MVLHDGREGVPAATAAHASAMQTNVPTADGAAKF